MTKPIVHYLKGSSLVPILVGLRAYVKPIDHPNTRHVSNRKWIRTSPVLSHDPETGNFETEFLLYRPMELQ